MTAYLTVEDRFLAKTERASNGCLLWTATLINSGYGRFWFEGKTELAHRVSFKLFVGEIPDGLNLDHTCHGIGCREDVICSHRRCVEPDHLEPETQRVNVLRGRTIPAHNRAKTHCMRNHEFTDDNTAVYFNKRSGLPYRVCKQCEYDKYHNQRRIRVRVA